jgi:hypothetical protein
MSEESKSDVVQPRFEIKKWNAVTMWSWDICADTCAICRNSLNEPSIEYQVSFLSCPLSCSPSFHMTGEPFTK